MQRWVLFDDPGGRRVNNGDRSARRLQIGLTLFLALAVIGGGVFALLTQTDPGADPTDPAASGVRIPAQKTTDLRAAAAAAGCTVREHRSEGDEHTGDPVAYRSNPPHSGDHAPVAAADGFYEDAPTTESQVHALEHGRVLIQFAPTASREVRGGLQTLFDEDRYHLLVLPNTTGMPYEVAATAWTRTITCPSSKPAVYDALRAFRKIWQDKAPEQVP